MEELANPNLLLATYETLLGLLMISLLVVAGLMVVIYAVFLCNECLLQPHRGLGLRRRMPRGGIRAWRRPSWRRPAPFLRRRASASF
jgi:hypothetical protein